MKIIVTIVPTDLLQIRFHLFFPSRRKQKQESSFQQVVGMVTRNISDFLFMTSLTRFQSFYEATFLHVIPVCITVPCF